MFKIHVSLLWLFLVLPVFSHGQCSDGTPDSFDWNDREDINLDKSRYIHEWIAINCGLTNAATVNVSLWRGEGKPEKKIVPDQHKVTELNQVFNITKLNFKNEGNYYCKACGRRDKSLGYLYINTDGKGYQTPEISNKSDHGVRYGSKLNMDCKVTGWYVMHWYWNDSPQPLASVYLGHWRKNGIRITQKRLIIERFTEKNDGLYTCMVQRQHVRWKASDNVYLKAKQVKPILKKKEDEINVINDTKTFIVLQCTVETSYPPAVFEWRECIHAFNNCSNIEGPNLFHKKGNSSKGESILIVTKQEFQKVSYQCSAKNNLGKDNLTWIVINKNGIVSMKPRITKTPQFETAGDNVTLVCESNGSVVMEWKKQFEKLRSKNTSYKRNGFVVTRKSLEIQNFTKMDEGLYECHVTVDKFNWNDHVKVTIGMEVKPKIIKSNSKIKIKYTKGMELKCELTTKAVPEAEILWSRCVCDADCSECNDWFKLRNTSIQAKSEIISVSIISSLTSKKVIYRCKAGNAVGSDERRWIVFKESTREDNNLFLIIIFCNIFLLFCILCIIVMELWKCTQDYIFQNRNDNEEQKTSYEVARGKPLYFDRETCL